METVAKKIFFGTNVIDRLTDVMSREEFKVWSVTRCGLSTYHLLLLFLVWGVLAGWVNMMANSLA